jgi:hypothetical protein
VLRLSLTFAVLLTTHVETSQFASTTGSELDHFKEIHRMSFLSFPFLVPGDGLPFNNFGEELRRRFDPM